MRASEQQRSGVVAWVEMWRPRLLLHNYTFTYQWHSRPCKDDTDEDVHFAQCLAAFAGFDAELHVYPAFWKLAPDLQQKTIVHELLHALAPSAVEAEIIALTEAFWRACQA
jgi:hypothetical protein